MSDFPPARIAPSLLSADFGQLGADAQFILEQGADTLHVDIMDGHFVPNLSFGMPTVQGLAKHTAKFSYTRPDGSQHTGAFLDCHLMVTNPQQWFPILHKIGIHGFTFHYEAVPDEEECIALLDQIRTAGITAGLALKPATPVSVISTRLAEHIDQFLVMTVEPGFGGQSFMHDMMPKVTELRRLYPSKLIQVDGGLDVQTTPIAAAAGANVIVSGSGVFRATSPSEAIVTMRSQVTEAQQHWNKQ